MNYLATREEKLCRYKGNTFVEAGREGIQYKTCKGAATDIKNKINRELLVSAEPKQSLKKIVSK